MTTTKRALGDPGTDPLAARPTPAWAEPGDRVAASLDTPVPAGLSDAEARRRLAVHGPNRLREMRRRSSWQILRDQFASPITALLAAAAVAAFAFDERVEGLAIGAVLALNAAIGFVTERRAVRSMDALRELGHTLATVRRAGSVVRLSAEQLVPGDVVVLEAGDVLTADVRLLSGSKLQVDESPLTGESLPVDKSEAPVSPDAALAERSCMLFKGTSVTRGSAEAVVVSTGMSTELGHISSLVEEAEGESTPLEERLDRLARRLIGLTLAIAAAVGAAVAASGRDLFLAVETGIALAVAAIPEGLPVVATVALARGMWRMARRNALVENLAAVETLGSTTVILTDKTGTLTENRMTAVELRLGEGRVRVEGTGLALRGSFHGEGEGTAVAESPALREALRIGVLCNNATLEREAAGEARAVGDPTEVALLIVGAKAGLERAQLLSASPEVGELAFDPETKRMATLHREAGRLLVAAKGAPEALLDSCSTLRTAAGARALQETDREEWRRVAGEMAAAGQRVLALASKTVDSEAAFDFAELELLALVGLSDPPREEIRGALETCRAAGIRVVMVTGDHGGTASAVAEALGLVEADSGPALDGRELGALTELAEDDVHRLLAAGVIARATPQQKLELIELHQAAGEVVAMTGDGVNDAPALRKADIGIAMGLRGTQVAREAADMVLKDDDFGTIVTAVAQGRAIFANIRKFVVYLMSCNVSEIFVVGLGALAQGPLPILPLQILFLNLVTDVFPALALGVCEGSPALLHEPPRDPREPMLTRRHWRGIFGLGGTMALSVLAALALSSRWLHHPDAEATSVSFLTLALAQLWHVFSMRNPGSARIRNEITGNPWIWAALLLCVALLLAAVYWAPLASVLSITPPNAAGWGLALSFSLVPLLAGQLSLARGRVHVAAPRSTVARHGR